jgi:hypothetical protein
MKRYAINPVVSLREEFEGALLYNPDTDDIIFINETGRLIWDAIARPRTVTGIAACLAANTVLAGALSSLSGNGLTPNGPVADAADVARIEADVTAFIGSLPPDFVVEYD